MSALWHLIYGKYSQKVLELLQNYRKMLEIGRYVIVYSCDEMRFRFKKYLKILREINS